MSSGGESECINVICDVDGNVQFQALARAGSDDWASGEQVSPHVGKPLIKTFWFDHLDCDHRELQQVLRKAGSGTADRVRVWMRVDEHQLIRAELTATPLTDASGQTQSVLVRTEPSHGTRRKRELGEPITKPVTQPGTPEHDLLKIRLSIAMLRVDLDSGTILGANDACSDLLLRQRDELIGVPFTEFVLEADRRALIEVLAATQNESDSIRALELNLITPDGQQRNARLSFTPDPSYAAPAALIVIKDLSAELVTHDLLRRADEMTSVLVRNAERLRQLEAFFDRSPVGLALFDRDQLIRSNKAFEAHRSELERQIDALQKSEDQVDAGHPAIIRFRAGETADAPLAIIAAHAPPGTSSDGSVTTAIRRSGRLTVIDVDEDGSIRVDADALSALQIDPPPAALADLFGEDALADVCSALQVIRTGESVDALDTRLINSRQVRISMASADKARVVLLLEDVSEWQNELRRLQAELQQQAESIAELTARAGTVDPVEFASAISLAADREAQLVSLVASMNAGTFTWDINSGTINADSRASELLGCGEAPTASTLLAAATLDERKTFEQHFSDAVSGGGTIDQTVHIGETHRPVRVVGHVLAETRDESADARALSAVVLDQVDASASQSRVVELERQLAIRTAELNAILESSREAIRIVSGGTLRHNTAAGELFSDDINAFMEASHHADAGQPDRMIQSSSTPIVVNGEVFGVVSVSSDQTEQTQLNDREAEVAAIFANTGVGVAFLDESAHVRELNAAMCAMIGYAPAQLIGRPLADFVHADDHPTLAGEFDAVASNTLQSCTSDLRLLRRDRASQWVHLTVTRPRGSSSPTTIVLAQDIQELRELRTLRDQLREELERTREQQLLIAATTQDAVLRISPNGRLIDANDFARTTLGLAGRESLSHLTFIAPETGNTLRDPLPWSRTAHDRPGVAELRVTRPDESTFVGRFTWRADADGNAVIHVVDVTRIHSMQEELQKAYARIVESHTLLQNRTRQLEGNFVSAVQQLGASIASAYGSSKALRNDSRLPKPLHELTKRVVDAFRVHRRLVQYYTASASSSWNAAVTDAVDVHELANDAVQALSERFNIAGRLEMDLSAAQHRCRLDGAMVRHAFWSIFAHAVSQATKTAARVTSTSLTSTHGSGRLRIDVEWPGTRAGTAELTLADSLIQSCGGSLQVRTASNSTSAAVEFDLDGGQPAAPAPARKDRTRVLLIEDHESTARVLRRQLERLGCDVVHAENLADARSMLERDGEIALLICDLTLPDADATNTIAQTLREIDIPAIALRSYGGAEAPKDLLAMGFVDHIDKPVDLKALSAAIGRFASTQGG